MLDPQTTAFVFPGQGSQFVGMGQALAQSSPAARATFAEADAALGFALSQLCWAGPDEALNDTVNTQPALLTASVAALRALHEQIGDYTPRLVAGHSLGEISALVAAGALEFEEGLALVRRRGELMKSAGERAPGGMSAILGMDAPALAEVCAEASAATGALVQVANDNCPGQVVISGELAALEAAETLAKAKGAKRARRLPVSIAAHSPLMQIVVADFRQAVEAVPFISPVPDLVANVTAAPMSDPNDLRVELPGQLTSPVRWTETIRYMVGAGITTFIEVGPKDVLHGLLKRIDPNVTGLTMGLPEEVAAVAAR